MSSRRPIEVHHCKRGHAFLRRHDACPECGRPLDTTLEDPGAVLVAQTVVRVNPEGCPFRLGLARAARGAQTLCIVGSDLPAEDGIRITLFVEDGLYHAGGGAPGEGR